MAEMTDLRDLNKNAPARPVETEPAAEAEHTHKRIEREAMKAAKRAGEHEHSNEPGTNEFSNVGPV